MSDAFLTQIEKPMQFSELHGQNSLFKIIIFVEFLYLSDIEGISRFLGSPNTMALPTGSKGKAKLKKLFRQANRTYHEGKRARTLIDSLDMQKIMDTSLAPLTMIESVIF